MRTRLLVVLLALVAMTAVPPESVLAESVGSVVGQVASCVEPGAVLRDAGARDGSDACPNDLAKRVTPPVLTVLAALVLATFVAGWARGRRDDAPLSSQRWRLVDAATGASAPWRAPPLPV